MAECFVLDLADEAATRRLADDLAAALRPGDLVALTGPLGAGKTTLARGILRALASDPALEVPSPTYSLLQPYALPRGSVAHLDLYRLADAAELAELGLDELAAGIVLVEWPERAGGRLPGRRLTVTLEPGASPDGRRARLQTDDADLGARLARSFAARQLMARAGFGEAGRTYLQGDASLRAYERLTDGPRRAVLLDQAPERDDDAGRARRAYRSAARLAEDIGPFVAVAEALKARGFSAPEVYGVDPEQGIVVMEDLGAEPVVAGDPPAPIPERYRGAVAVLAAMHGLAWPDEVPAPVTPSCPDGRHRLPRLAREVLANEVAVLIDWGFPYFAERPAREPERARFLALWDSLFDALAPSPQTWVLRDYHSPNLLWLPGREGIARVGILDFQDALVGSPAYDVASLCQDARVTVSPALEAELLRVYVAARTGRPAFEPEAFARDYAILAAQRATRILGVFPRLLLRDGKPQYLQHIPRVAGYLARVIDTPVLQPLKLWYEQHLPAVLHAGSVPPSATAESSA